MNNMEGNYLITKDKYLEETEDYVLVARQSEDIDTNQKVYAIINKLTDVIEYEVSFLVQALEGVQDMQKLLDEYRAKKNPKRSAATLKIH